MNIFRNIGWFVIGTSCLLLGACVKAPPGSASSVTTVPVSASPAASAVPAVKPGSPAPTGGPALSTDQVYQAVQAAWAATDKAGPRRVSQVSYKGGVAVTKIEAQTVPPNSHQVITVNGQVMSEQYIFGGVIYLKQNGTWIKTSADALPQAVNALADVTAGLKDQIVHSDGKVLGTEAVNGKPATIYSYSDTLKDLKSAEPTVHKVWVDNGTGAIVRQESLHKTDRMVQDIVYDSGLSVTLPPEAAAAKTQN